MDYLRRQQLTQEKAFILAQIEEHEYEISILRKQLRDIELELETEK